MKVRRAFLGWISFAAAWSSAAAPTPPDILRWRHYEEPAFPLPLFSTRVRDGFANVIFTFDANGRITDRIVTAASHPAFVVAVYEAMQRWEIDTSELAVSRFRESLRFDFERRGSVVTMTQRDAVKAALTPYVDQGATALLTLREEDLNFPLETVATAIPVFPPALSARHVTGFATVSFIVDAEGRVRVAAVTDATEREFRETALTAIQAWRFAPPKHLGMAVLVMAERTFRFGAPPPKSATP